MNKQNLLLSRSYANIRYAIVNLRFIIVSLFLSIFMLFGCSSNQDQAELNISTLNSDTESSNKSDLIMLAKIDSHYQKWKHTPYRYGGDTLKGSDCSGLVKNFFLTKMSKNIPRTTVEQAKLGQKVTNPQAGDLVFFKTGRGRNGLHVGIYYAEGKFLHASTSKGVIYSNLNESYWKKHYWMTRRIDS